MVKAIVLLRRPENVETFMEQYRAVHLPVIRQMPGLCKLELHHLFDGTGGAANPFLMIELYFASREAMVTAMQSEPGRASGQYLQDLAASQGADGYPAVQVMFADVETEEFS